ncbi:hypothetical protein E2C01_095971 [Portunus trituberculatus]|uniref:Uncharacterized protein n=1 Tax=Portunus trituberculatus TaxID=210409 RepID=A0A5B7K0S2_PORTR|nr:hypothetical protein [Portunus trituberculatus]
MGWCFLGVCFSPNKGHKRGRPSPVPSCDSRPRPQRPKTRPRKGK